MPLLENFRSYLAFGMDVAFEPDRGCEIRMVDRFGRDKTLAEFGVRG